MIMAKMIKIGRWEIPAELFEQYVRAISATERSGERYCYAFDEGRKTVHTEIIKCVGLLPHTREYLEFDKALHDLCEDMLPARFPPQEITMIKNPPIRGLMGAR